MSYLKSKFFGQSIENLKVAIGNPVYKREFRRFRRLMPKFKITEILGIIWCTMRPIEREAVLRSHNDEICEELEFILRNDEEDERFGT